MTNKELKEEFYLVTGHVSVNRPCEYKLFCAAIKSENERCSEILDLSDSDLLLMAGEMSAQELRTVKAVLKALKSRMENGYSI